MSGPPMVKPNWFWFCCGRFGEKNPRESKTVFRRYSNSDPCRSLVPDLMV